MNDDRAALRRRLRQQRKAFSPVERILAADLLATHILALPFLPRTGYIAGYWAMDGEIGLHSVQLRLPDPLTYCLPVLDGEYLKFAPWRPGDSLITNRFGVPEPDVAPSVLVAPEKLAMAIVPLVGFDPSGNRLGMGGGWYDRSFAFRRRHVAPPWLVGAGFSVQEIAPLETEAWDVPTDAICTERFCTLHATLDRPS